MLTRVLWASLCVAFVALCPVARGETIKLDDGEYAVLKQVAGKTFWVRAELAPRPGEKALGAFALAFGTQGADGTYRLHATDKGWTLESRLGGQTRALAAGMERLDNLAGLDLRIWRGPRLLTVVADGRILACVLDSALSGGAVALRGSLAVTKFQVQLTPAIEFGDDFMRPEENEELAPWQKVAGEWKFHSVRESDTTVEVEKLPEKRRPDFERSPNPFSLEGRHGEKEPYALVTTGYWFWNDYELAASARCPGGTWGIVFDYRSAQDFYAVRWNLDSPLLAPTPVELVRFRDGKQSVLATAWVEGQRDQWYRLGVRTFGGRVEVMLDGSVIIDTFQKEAWGGAIGLYVEGAKPVAFDDVLVRPVTRVDLDAPEALDRFTRKDGRWKTVVRHRKGYTDTLGLVATAGSGTCEFGSANWTGYELDATCPVPAGGRTVRLLVGREPDGSAYELVLTRTGDSGALALDRLEAGGKARKTLASCDDVALPARGGLPIRVDGTRETEMRVYADDLLVLRARLPRPVQGSAAVSVSGMPGAAFDRLRVLFEREEDVERPPKVGIFAEDPFMKLWSSPEGDWWPDAEKPNTCWHNGDFYGRSEITIPVRPGLMLVHSASTISEKGGYALVQEKAGGDGGALVRLLRLGKPVGEAPVKAGGPSEITIHKDGRYLWVSAGDTELFVFRDPAPLSGHRLAVTSPEEINLAAIKVRRFQVADYYFEEAPSDWMRVGEWEVTNRFVCDPRWSHMAARTDFGAMLFSKLRFEGDVTMEGYMGMRMRKDTKYTTSYPRVGDLNMSLCGDGRRLDTGYGCVLAGWDPFWSESDTWLMRNGVRVAESARQLVPGTRERSPTTRVIEVPWISKGRPVHGAWYYLKARKTGKNVEYFFDGVPVYQFRDPDPLPGGHAALWTYDAWIVVARVKISYERKVFPGRLVEAPAPVRAVETDQDLAPVVTSYTHPGLTFNFEPSLQGWSTSDPESGALLSLVPREGGGHCLRAANIKPGGDFAAVAPLNAQTIDPLAVSELAFDYRIEPGAKINLYLTFGGKRAFVRLTGPAESGPLIHRLADVAAVDDGKWHHARVPLAAAVSEWSKENPGTVTAIAFGSCHPGYLQAGIGGNAGGATYEIDNFRLASFGRGKFRYGVRLESGGNHEAVLALLDRKPDSEPTEPAVPLEEELASGRWWLHVRMRRPGGKLTRTAHFPFYVSGKAPVFAGVEPADGGPWGFGPIVMELAGGDALDLNPRTVRLTVGGRDLETGEFGAHYDWRTRRLSLDLAHTPLHVTSGAVVPVRIAVSDLAGQPALWEGRFKVDAALDKTPPSRVRLARPCIAQDFETGLHSWQAGSGALLDRDDSTAAEGSASLRIASPSLAANLFAYAVHDSFDASQFPLLEFDYRIHAGVQTDCVLSVAGLSHSIGMTDRSGQGRFLGSFEPPVAADDTWNHAEFRLLQALRAQPYRERMFMVDWLGFGDYGYRANAPGAFYHIDNLRLVPLISGVRPLQLSWQAVDASGIKGYSFVLDDQPQTEPDTRINSASATATFEKLPAREAVYFHVRACDGAGNWGPAEHFRFMADCTPPVIGRPSPGPGERSASSRIRIPMNDAESGVDPETLEVNIDGRSFRPGRKGVSFDVHGQVFEWDWTQGRPADQRSVPDGKQVVVKVGARDFAGNAAKPFQWSWTMDYRRDKEPPAIESISSGSQKVLAYHDFQQGTDGWGPRHPSHGARVKRVVRDRKTGDHCISLTCPSNQATFGTKADIAPYDVADYPIIAFDYAVPADIKVNLSLWTNMGWVTIQMSSPKPYGRKIGGIEDFTADGTWRFTWVDVQKLLKAVWPKTSRFTIRQVVFGDLARGGSKKGAVWYLDNLIIAGYGEPAAEFKWQALDITGIQGYAWSVDRTWATDAPAKVMTSDPRAETQLAEPGLYYLHLRALDHGGNWSGTVHYPYFVHVSEKPSGKAPEEKPAAPPAKETEKKPAKPAAEPAQ
jgi:hypothetical protein